jgi:antitoxin component YwqK of YwqJK toxin-antitoxin module
MKRLLFFLSIIISTALFAQTDKYVFDTITRTEQFFNDNGHVSCEIIQLDKIMDKHRHIIHYSKSGQKTKEFFDKNRVVYDTLREWTDKGKLHHMEVYSDSGFTAIDYWSETRRILAIGQYKIANPPPDKITIYDSTTYNIYETEKCDNPCYIRIGSWKYFYENGNLETVGQYLPMHFVYIIPTRDSSNVAIPIKKTSFETIPNISYMLVKTYLQDGLWIYYDDKGEKTKEEFYKNGRTRLQ